MNKTPPIVKSLSESLTKSAIKSPAAPSQQDVVNLFSKRGLTISTVTYLYLYNSIYSF